MMRLLLILLYAIVLACPVTSLAQKPNAAPAAPPAISADQARAALDVLNDPGKRAAFAATLNAIVKTLPATQAAAEPAKPALAETTTVEGVAIPLAPDSLGAQVLLSAASFVNSLGNQAMDALDTVQSLPLLYGWVVVMATNPIARDLLVDVGWRVILVLACAAVVEFGLRHALRRPIHGLEALAPVAWGTDHQGDASDPDASDPVNPDPRTVDALTPKSITTDVAADAIASDRSPLVPSVTDGDKVDGGEHLTVRTRPKPSAWTLLNRVPLVFARLVLELVPVIGILVIGHLFVGSALGGQTVSRLIILAVVDSYAICMTLLSVARMLLSPDEARLRLFHIRNATAAYLMRWTRRLILVAVFGYAVGEVGLLLGLSDLAHEAMQKGIGLVLHVILAGVVLANRRPMRRWLRAPDDSKGPVASVRNRFARVWHWVALFFLIAGWLTWAVEVPHGFTLVLHYFVVTTLVLIGSRLLILLLLGMVDRTMRPAPDAAPPPHSLHARLSTYHPAVSVAVRAAVYTMCTVGLLQLYGLNTFLWLVSSPLGQRILSGIATLVLTIVLTFGIWEAVNGGVQQHLDRLQREAQLAKSARLRTLLPLLRTMLLIIIAIVAGLMILSEIGINIAPLLAGAGIVGVAIGFGSQKLVQDLITGIFLLLENAMQVGDYVTVSGLSGVVEALSVRTIRLRAADGSVHIIPFSSVTSVTNVNRGLGNASVNVTVGFDEDTDRVADEIRSIVAGMRSDPVLSAQMLSDCQLWGVDKVDGASVTIAGQVVCTDSGRWPVQREFNRRMKRRFQELGIRIFNPLQTITVPALIQAPAERGNDHGHAAAAD